MLGDFQISTTIGYRDKHFEKNSGIFGQDGELLVSSSHLVHSVGFSPDKNILPNLGRIAEAQKDGGGKHFLVFGLPGRASSDRWMGSFEVSCYILLILRPLNSQRMVLEGGSDLLQLRFSDTTNLYISRLIHAGHRVTLACRHFHVVDKIGSTHGDFFQLAIESCWSLCASSIDESERM